MNQEKTKMSKVGEKFEDVIGRRDEEELLVFENGALQIKGDAKPRFKAIRDLREDKKKILNEL